MKYKYECIWLEDLKDMGATLYFCELSRDEGGYKIPIDGCPDKCKKYISETDMMMKIKVLKMFDEFLSADGVSYEDFEPVDNKLYLNPVCRNCKHSSYCNNIPTDENNEDIEYYDIYGCPDLSVRKCKNAEYDY